MHGDNLHLTHHLLPGVPHWNLKAATQILREDAEFLAWDELHGGIFSSDSHTRTSLVKFIMNEQQFLTEFQHPSASGMREA